MEFKEFREFIKYKIGVMKKIGGRGSPLFKIESEEEFHKMKEEYQKTVTTEFCKRYLIGISMCISVFGHKQKRVTSPRMKKGKTVKGKTVKTQEYNDLFSKEIESKKKEIMKNLKINENQLHKLNVKYTISELSMATREGGKIFIPEIVFKKK